MKIYDFCLRQSPPGAAPYLCHDGNHFTATDVLPNGVTGARLVNEWLDYNCPATIGEMNLITDFLNTQPKGDSHDYRC